MCSDSLSGARLSLLATAGLLLLLNPIEAQWVPALEGKVRGQSGAAIWELVGNEVAKAIRD